MNTTSIPSAASPVALDLRTTVTIGKALGLPLIPIPARAKSPVAAEWQKKDFVEDDFDTNGNVGLRLDAVVDGDMDSEYALKLARGRAARNARAAGVEGRPGRPRSADPRAPKNRERSRSWGIDPGRNTFPAKGSTWAPTVFLRLQIRPCS